MHEDWELIIILAFHAAFIASIFFLLAYGLRRIGKS